MTLLELCEYLEGCYIQLCYDPITEQLEAYGRIDVLGMSDIKYFLKLYRPALVDACQMVVRAPSGNNAPWHISVTV